MRWFSWAAKMAILVGLVYAVRQRWLSIQEENWALERRSEPDPEALGAVAQSRIGVNLDRLKNLPSGQYRPLVEYLTYIQVQRGENEETLVFVRQRDLDALADLAGEPRDGMVEEFKQLGVLLSMN